MYILIFPRNSLLFIPILAIINSFHAYLICNPKVTHILNVTLDINFTRVMICETLFHIS